MVNKRMTGGKWNEHNNTGKVVEKIKPDASFSQIFSESGNRNENQN